MKIGSFKRSLIAAALGWGPSALLAAVIPVTNLTDSAPGSLRAAIAAAASGDTVDATGLTGTITLTSDQLLINKDLTLKGPGAALLTVSGNDFLRVFRTVPGTTVTISGLTIARGQSFDGGAGIFNDRATLTVDACTLTQNSELSGEGGGAIFNLGGKGPDNVVGNATLTLLNSTISHNLCAGPPDYTIGYGGGVLNQGAFSGVATLTVINSTFSQNSAGVNGEGGAIWNFGAFSGTATATIMNCTFSQNEADWGSAIANEGVLSGTASVQIGSSILANSTSGPYIDNFGGTVASLGYNLSDDATGPNDGTIDLLSTDPLLGPLQDNGGPTFTHALLNLSPAINAGDPASTLATDQRGFPRPVDGRVDIGAFESRSCLPHVTVMNANDSGYGSLRQALADLCSGGTIDFAPSLHGQTITLTSGQLVVPKTSTINGPGADLLTISGNHASRVFNIPGGTSAWISGLTVADGVGNDDLNSGGGFFVVGNLSLSHCTVRGNAGGFDPRERQVGGAITSYGRLTLGDCTVTENSEVRAGILLLGGQIEVTINNSTISQNTGAGIVAQGFEQSINISNSSISENVGHALAVIGNEVSLVNCTLSRNVSVGILVRRGGKARVSHSTIVGNRIGIDGDDDTIRIDNSIVAKNSTRDMGWGQGGGIVFNSLGYNLIGNGESIFGLVPQDRFGTTASPLDPLLGPLQDNGGPTFTHALLAGSPALDAGDPDSNLTADQRGLLRPVNARIDIGAFESQTQNTGPQVACSEAATFECAPDSGLAVAVQAAVTDPDFGQTLTVTLKQGALVLDTQTVASPAAGVLVTFNPVTFLPGLHPLTVEVDDANEVSLCQTTVTLNTDTEPPRITCPANVEVPADPGNTAASVSYPAPVTSDNCTVANVTCTPASGSTFPVGTTTVVCTVTDAAGLTATGSFTVTVLSAEDQIRRCIALVDGFDPKKEKQLMNYLDDTLKELAKDKKDTLKKACKKLDEFIKKVQEALKKGHVTPAQGAQLIVCATQARTTLNCP